LGGEYAADIALLNIYCNERGEKLLTMRFALDLDPGHPPVSRLDPVHTYVRALWELGGSVLKRLVRSVLPLGN